MANVIPTPSMSLQKKKKKHDQIRVGGARTACMTCVVRGESQATSEKVIERRKKIEARPRKKKRNSRMDFGVKRPEHVSDATGPQDEFEFFPEGISQYWRI
jgi:hypothetical protein